MLSTKQKTFGGQLIIGRNEWCALPDLHVPAIKVKIDTGARTSAIHAFNIEPVMRQGIKYVHFDILPLQTNGDILIACKAPILDERYIMSSNGHKEHRYVIATQLRLNQELWNIELTLSNRDPLRFRMLLGREALSNRVLIHPGITCHQGKVSKQQLRKIYQKFLPVI